MKFIFFYLTIILLTSNCSLNKDSKFWTDEIIKNEENQNKLTKILKKSDGIMSMTLQEYKIYIDDYTKKNKYPDISQ